MKQSEIMLANLKERAKQACASAYAPYSKFHVGAAVAAAGGTIFSGCNVENAAFGLTLCAERNALAAAVAAGAVGLHIVLIYTPGQRAHAPCGACRQVMQELMDPMAKVVACCDSADTKEWTVASVLPDPFVTEESLGR